MDVALLAMPLSPLAGTPAKPSMLATIARLVAV